jgi:hypothetical protein
VPQDNILHSFSVETLCSKEKETAFSVAKCTSIYIYIQTTLKFVALQGAPCIYIHISSLRVNIGYALLYDLCYVMLGYIMLL